MVFETPGPLLILAFAFVPPLVFMVRIRNIERFDRNPMWLMFFIFAWGAIAAIILSLIIESRLDTPLDTYRPVLVPHDVWLAVLLAPLAEEPTKVAIIWFMSKRRLREEEDGLVYGAAAGLGFAATENLFYEFAALTLAETVQAGVAAWITVSIMRMLTSTLLHASSSAIAGWGVAKARLTPGHGGDLVKYLGIAMLCHATFNFLATLPIFFPESFTVALVSLLLVFVFAGGIFRFIRAKIRELDRRGAPAFAV